MHPAAGRVISIVAISVCSVPVNQTLNENGTRVKAWLPGVDWNPSPTTVRASVIVLPRRVTDITLVFYVAWSSHPTEAKNWEAATLRNVFSSSFLSCAPIIFVSPIHAHNRR